MYPYAHGNNTHQHPIYAHYHTNITSHPAITQPKRYKHDYPLGYSRAYDVNPFTIDDLREWIHEYNKGIHQHNQYFKERNLNIVSEIRHNDFTWNQSWKNYQQSYPSFYPKEYQVIEAFLTSFIKKWNEISHRTFYPYKYKVIHILKSTHSIQYTLHVVLVSNITQHGYTLETSFLTRENDIFPQKVKFIGRMTTDKVLLPPAYNEYHMKKGKEYKALHPLLAIPTEMIVQDSPEYLHEYHNITKKLKWYSSHPPDE